MPDPLSELRSWLNARIAKEDALATRNTARGLYGDGADGHARVQAFRDVLDHLNQLEGRDS
jgi:hypothetical protein